MKNPEVDLKLSYAQIIILIRCLDNGIEKLEQKCLQTKKIVSEDKFQSYKEIYEKDIAFMEEIKTDLKEKTEWIYGQLGN